MAFCNLDKCIYYGVGKYDFPELEPFNGEVPSHWIRFTDIGKFPLSEKTGVHFFQDDAKFEAIWNRPNKYIDKFKKIGVLCQPDFSVYTDFPRAVQIYNKYRNHWLARFYSDRGIKVLPFVMWSTPDNFDWCFDGTPANSTVSITTNGTINDKEAHNYFLLGYEEMMKRLKPKKVVVFTVTEKTDQIGISGDHIQFVNCAVRKTLKKEG